MVSKRRTGARTEHRISFCSPLTDHQTQSTESMRLGLPWGSLAMPSARTREQIAAPRRAAALSMDVHVRPRDVRSATWQSSPSGCRQLRPMRERENPG